MKKSKFNVNNTKDGKKNRTFEGILFDSELELRYYRDYLLPLKEEGRITKIILQPKYILQEKFNKYGKVILPINYVGDFEVFYSDGTSILVDIKGLPSPESKIKKKLFDFRYPQKTLHWITFSKCDGGWIFYDDLVKARAKRKREKLK